MNQDIKSLVIRFVNNLKKSWMLGTICVIAAVAFVVVTTFLVSDDAGDEVAQSTSLIGVQSVVKINWGFESEDSEQSNGAVYEAKVVAAKEDLAVITTLFDSGNVWNTINDRLKEQEQIEITDEDYVLKANGYNTIQIKVVGYDAEAVQVIEKIVRDELETLVKNYYDVDAVDVISTPVVLEAETIGEEYILSNNKYEIEADTNNLLVEDGEKKLFSFPNIIIILSSVVLWIVIVALNTIADKKIYEIADLEVDELVCLGKLQEEEEYQNTVSIVCKKISNSEFKNTKVVSLTDEITTKVVKFGELIKEKSGANVEVLSWKEGAIDQIEQNDNVFLYVESGTKSNDEIVVCVDAIKLTDAKCIGWVLSK